MYTHEDKREIEVLRERIARLCAAMKHINASLDPHTVLREILMSAQGADRCRLRGHRHRR